jgi:hypothetical protein
MSSRLERAFVSSVSYMILLSVSAPEPLAKGIVGLVLGVTIPPGLGAVTPPSLPFDADPDGDDSDHELHFLPNFFLSPLTARFSDFLGEDGTRFP